MLRDINVASIAAAKAEDARKAIDDIKRGLKDPLDFLEENNDYSGLEILKKAME